MAVYVESSDTADLFLLSLDHFDRKYRKPNRVNDTWDMKKKDRERYENDPKVKHIHMDFSESSWEWE